VRLPYHKPVYYQYPIHRPQYPSLHMLCSRLPIQEHSTSKPSPRPMFGFPASQNHRFSSDTCVHVPLRCSRCTSFASLELDAAPQGPVSIIDIMKQVHILIWCHFHIVPPFASAPYSAERVLSFLADGCSSIVLRLPSTFTHTEQPDTRRPKRCKMYLGPVSVCQRITLT